MNTLSEHMLSHVSEFIADHLALNFPRDRWSDLERKISSAAKEFGYADVKNFVQRILSSPMTPEHVEILTTYLTVNESYFWREPETFEALEQTIIPELIRSRLDEKRIRIWSAGCSTGEEPYSIAISLHRVIPRLEDWNITILATDISPRILHRASTGLFDKWSFRNSPVWLKEKYFSYKEDDAFKIIPEIKRMVKFEYLNLADDVYPSPLNDTNAMDIIFCRNVLMYFTEKRRKQIVHGLYNSLIQDGYLVVSAYELSLPILSEFTIRNFPGMVIHQKGSKKWNTQQQVHSDIPVLLPVISSGTSNPFNTMTETKPHLNKIEETAHLKIETTVKNNSLYTNAVVSYAQGNYSNVVVELQKNDQTLDELILLIRAYANQGMLGKALESCEKAVAANKLNSGLQYLYAAILQEDNQLDEAVKSLKRAIYLNPNFVLGHYSLGKVYQRLGNKKWADKCTENVLTILDSNSQDDILAESEGLTAGRFKEIISSC